MPVVVVSLAWCVGLLLFYVAGQRWLLRSRSRARVFETAGQEQGLPTTAGDEAQNFFASWLARAGYRSPGAPALFLGINLLTTCAGLVTVYLLFALGLVAEASRFGRVIPGAVGELGEALFRAAPWLVLAMLIALPTLAVRDARKRRIVQVEQDLPVFLELLATLTEAGLGFDAALDRVLEAQPSERVLTIEFRTFQMEVLAGRPRVRSLRRVARRVDAPSLSLFISALVQSEQVGSGVADVLRRQADDLRERRRESAIALASSLPVKLMFPLVICFLPGIFVLTLGPVFYQLFQVADTILQSPAGR